MHPPSSRAAAVTPLSAYFFVRDRSDILMSPQRCGGLACAIAHSGSNEAVVSTRVEVPGSRTPTTSEGKQATLRYSLCLAVLTDNRLFVRDTSPRCVRISSIVRVDGQREVCGTGRFGESPENARSGPNRGEVLDLLARVWTKLGLAGRHGAARQISPWQSQASSAQEFRKYHQIMKFRTCRSVDQSLKLPAILPMRRAPPRGAHTHLRSTPSASLPAQT